MAIATNTKSSEKQPRQRATSAPAQVIAKHAIEGIREKKGRDVTVIDMRTVSGVADYFVLATGDSDLQIKAIVEAVRAKIKEACNERPWHVEGYTNRRWVLLDYVDVVIHVFDEERRGYYDLERLWADAPHQLISDKADLDGIELFQTDETTQ